MKKVRNILLISGMFVLLVGAGLSFMQYQPWANYALIGGAALIIIRGFLRSEPESNCQCDCQSSKESDKSEQENTKNPDEQ